MIRGQHGSPTRVWIDDPHPIFRQGMVSSLRDHFWVMGESSGFRPRPDVDGLDVLTFVAARGALRDALELVEDRDVRLVAVVGATEAQEDTLLEMVEAGVAAVLLRPEITPDALRETLRTVALGNASLPVDLVPRLLERAAQGAGGRPDGLAEREVDVLRLLAEGERTRGIAQTLCYSERTVKNIVHDLLTKMNCRTRAHAVAIATRQGLI